MATTAITTEVPDIQRVGTKLIIPVPWREADALHTHLQRLGIPSIACWDPMERQARLEVFAGVEEERVREAVRDWLS
jgi:hypothetical protein